MPTIKDKLTGDVVSRQPYTAEGTQRAEQIAESDQNWEVDHTPTQDGAARSVIEYAGGGKTGYDAIGNPMYQEGGSVYEKNKAKREKIAEANKEMAKSSKKKREERRENRKARRKLRKEMRELKKSAVAFTKDKQRREEAEHRKLTLEGEGFRSKKSERKTKQAFRKQRRKAVKATKAKVRKSVTAFMSDEKDEYKKGGSVTEKKELSKRETKREIRKRFKTNVSIEDTKRKDVQEHYGTEGDTRATRKALKKHKKEKRKKYLDAAKDKNKTVTFHKSGATSITEKRKKK